MSRKHRPVVYARPTPLPPIPTIPIPARYRRAILPLALVVCLLSTAYIWFRTEQASESMRRYAQAALCGSTTTSGCRREIVATVVQLQQTPRSKGGVDQWVTLQLPGETRTVRSIDGDLYATLHEGAAVRATEWDGQVVELHDAANRQMLTDASPAAEEHSGSFLRIGGVLISYILIMLMIKRVWLDKTPTPPPPSTLPPLRTFPTPTQTRNQLTEAETASLPRAGAEAKTQALTPPSDRHSG